jgi:hypothetical protein|tara:strand:- start:1320 stop:1547 length:228 start_codon:yes stop_codon:yes gene_type:complete
MFVHVMTKAEVEASNARLDAWWDSLGWDVKQALQRLVTVAQNPIDSTLPVSYADEPRVGHITVTHSGGGIGSQTG